MKKGQNEEMAYVRKHRVYMRVFRELRWQETSKPPICTSCADTNKGTKEHPNARCRWVAKEFHTYDDPELFAPTSPLEGVKLVLFQAASTSDPDANVMVLDVRRACFYAEATRRVVVELLPEEWQPGDEGKCGLLLKSLARYPRHCHELGEGVGGVPRVRRLCPGESKQVLLQTHHQVTHGGGAR